MHHIFDKVSKSTDCWYEVPWKKCLHTEQTINDVYCPWELKWQLPVLSLSCYTDYNWMQRHKHGDPVWATYVTRSNFTQKKVTRIHDQKTGICWLDPYQIMIKWQQWISIRQIIWDMAHAVVQRWNNLLHDTCSDVNTTYMYPYCLAALHWELISSAKAW